MIFSRKISFPGRDLLTYLPFMCSDRLEPRWEVLDWSVYGQQNHRLRGGLKQSGWLKQGELPRTPPTNSFFGDVSEWKNSPLYPLIIFLCFLLNSRKKHGFGDGLGGLSDVDDGVNWFGFQWIYFKRQTSLWLEHDLQWDDVVPGSSQVCKACACSLSPQKTKPKGKYSTYLEDPNMFIIRVIGPRRKKGSLNLICCFLLFFFSISWPFKWCCWWLSPVFPCWECWLVLIFGCFQK